MYVYVICKLDMCTCMYMYVCHYHMYVKLHVCMYMSCVCVLYHIHAVWYMYTCTTNVFLLCFETQVYNYDLDRRHI
jgi:hypothetical protein